MKKKYQYLCYALHFMDEEHSGGIFQIVAVPSTKPIETDVQKEWLKRECEKYTNWSVDIIISMEVR